MSALQIEGPRDGVARLTLDRPEKRNALDLSLRAELAEAFDRLDRADDARCVILAGAPDVFAAGADLREMAQRTPLDPKLEAGQVLWTSLERFSKPVIAAVRGYALGGGCELAMACDVVIAGRGATFGFPEVKLGILAAAGGTRRLLQLAGHQKAMRWLLTGDRFDAQTALDLGIASEIVDDDAVLTHASDIAARIAGAAPLAVRSIKALARLQANASASAEMDRQAFKLLLGSEDFAEGIAAFFEKRPPAFKGR